MPPCPTLLHTRFLYPFQFAPGEKRRLHQDLGSIAWPLRDRQVAVWQGPDPMPERYLQEMLPQVRHFLGAPADDSPGTLAESICEPGEPPVMRYWRVPNELLNAWFRHGVEVHEGGVLPAPPEHRFTAMPIAEIGIELFVSPHGAGILSIALAAAPAQWAQPATSHATAPCAEERVRRFNYRLSQCGRKQKSVPWLVVPGRPQAPAASALGTAWGTASGTAGGTSVEPVLEPTFETGGDVDGAMRFERAVDSPLVARLGKPGQAFQLHELVDFLLPPQHEAGRPVLATQEQLSVYSVVRFGSETDFASEASRAALGPFLTGLAEIEEPSHAGHLYMDGLDVPNAVMNRRHWAAVGYLGAVHFVADQEGSHPYNEQRVRTVRDKYFVCYLISYFQRLALHRVLRRAREILCEAPVFDAASETHRHAAPRTDAEHRAPQALAERDTRPASDPGAPRHGLEPASLNAAQIRAFAGLNVELLHLRLGSGFTEISSREALNRFYDIAQAGLRVEAARAAIGASVAEFDAAQQERIASEQASAMATNTAAVRTAIEKVAVIQQKVEWLEVFFASFYAVELAHILIGAGELRERLLVLLAGFMAAIFAMAGLRPWHGSGKFPPVLLPMVIGAILLFLLLVFPAEQLSVISEAVRNAIQKWGLR